MRYYFHLLNGTGRTPDDEGRELATLAAARGEAIRGIRSIAAEELSRGVIDLRGRVEICDAEGKLLLSVAFVEAVEIRLPARNPDD